MTSFLTILGVNYENSVRIYNIDYLMLASKHNKFSTIDWPIASGSRVSFNGIRVKLNFEIGDDLWIIFFDVAYVFVLIGCVLYH